MKSGIGILSLFAFGCATLVSMPTMAHAQAGGYAASLENEIVEECRTASTSSRHLRARSEGRLSCREGYVDALRKRSTASGVSYSEVADRAVQLARLYDQRSHRQQIWLDYAATGVFVFGVAHLAATDGGNAAANWGYATLLPLLITQVNAFEPTRDLFYGGKIGMTLINERYAALARHGALLDRNVASIKRRLASNDMPYNAVKACGALETALQAARGWPKDEPDAAFVLRDAVALSVRCNDVAANRLALIRFAELLADAQTTTLPYDYISDVLALDSALVQRDYDLRFSPTETLTGILAAPFNLASTLLTGENGAKAVSSLKTQAAFTQLNAELSTINLPVVPSINLADVSISAAAAGRVGVSRAAPADKQFTDLYAAMGAAVSALNEEQKTLAVANMLYGPVRDAAAAQQLVFSYDANTHSAIVALAAPKPEAAKAEAKPAS